MNEQLSRWVGAAAMALALGAAALWAGAEFAVAEGFVFPPLEVPGMLGFTVVGTLILWRRPGHTIGYVLCGIGVAWLLHAGGATYGVAGVGRGWPAAPWAAWLGSLWVPGALLTFAVLPLLFPDGHLPTRRWRVVLWATVVALVVGTVHNGFLVDPLQPGGLGSEVVNPAYLPALAPLREPFASAFELLLLFSLFGAAISLVVRFRRSVGVERQQMKWFVAAAVLMPIALFASGIEPIGDLAVHLFGPLLIAVSASIGLAVLRYRLYEIDRIVSRTVTYATVVALLLAVCWTAAFALGGLARAATGDAGGDLAVAGSTLLAAALFLPLRDRVRAIVDRRFNRTGYNAERTVAAFAHRLRDEMQLDKLRADLVETAGATVAPTQAGIWFPPDPPGDGPLGVGGAGPSTLASAAGRPQRPS